MRGIVYRVKLSADGTSRAGVPVEYFKSNARFRDVAISPDGLTIYVAADRGPQDNPDSILAFSYQRR